MPVWTGSIWQQIEKLSNVKLWFRRDPSPPPPPNLRHTLHGRNIISSSFSVRALEDVLGICVLFIIL